MDHDNDQFPIIKSSSPQFPSFFKQLNQDISHVNAPPSEDKIMRETSSYEKLKKVQSLSEQLGHEILPNSQLHPAPIPSNIDFQKKKQNAQTQHEQGISAHQQNMSREITHSQHQFETQKRMILSQGDQFSKVFSLFGQNPLDSDNQIQENGMRIQQKYQQIQKEIEAVRKHIQGDGQC